MERLNETQNALQTQKDQTGELSQQTTLVNNFLKDEDGHLKQLEKSIESEKSQSLKLSQDVYNAHQKEKNLLAEIHGSQTLAKNLAQRQRDAEADGASIQHEFPGAADGAQNRANRGREN